MWPAARDRREPDVRFAGWIEAAQEGAVGENLGIWGACGGLQTSEAEVVGDASTGGESVAIEQAIPLAFMRG